MKGRPRTLDHDAVLDRWARGETAAEIADALGLKRPQTAIVIIRRARRHGDRRAARRVQGYGIGHEIVGLSLTADDYMRLFDAAAARGLSPGRLASKLIRVIVNDDLFNAILDDGEESTRSAA